MVDLHARRFVPVLIVSAAAGALFAADAVKVEKTKTVARCQAVKDGRQCENEAAEGASYCWKHQGLRALNDTTNTWNAAKSGATNAWSVTRSGVSNAWNAVKGAADDARKGVSELLKNAKKKR